MSDTACVNEPAMRGIDTDIGTDVHVDIDRDVDANAATDLDTDRYGLGSGYIGLDVYVLHTEIHPNIESWSPKACGA